MNKKILSLIVVMLMLVVILPGTALADEEKQVIVTTVEPQMTLEQVSRSNQIPLEIVVKALGGGGFAANNTVQQVMDEKGVPLETVKSKVRDLQVESSVEGSKDWFKIKLKFFLWGVFIISGMILLNKAGKNKNVHTRRKYFLAAAVLVFGLWLGSDPNPVGTIKDALVLYGQEGIIFKPRLVAMAVFLLTVILGGRMLCGWGCQLGTLQELLYKLPTPKVLLPFRISQAIRVIFFAAMTVLALGWGYDVVGPYDPFKIFALKPILFWSSTLVVAVLLILSLFIYRPWCQFLCPFGLVAWLMEKVSWFRVRVNKQACMDCGACYKVCPTGAIEAKHSGQSEIDCYNCSACIDKCPANAICYSKGLPEENIQEDKEMVKV